MLSPHKEVYGQPPPQTGCWWNAEPGILSEHTGSEPLRQGEIRSGPCLNMRFTMGVYCAVLTAEILKIGKILLWSAFSLLSLDRLTQEFGVPCLRLAWLLSTLCFPCLLR